MACVCNCLGNTTAEEQAYDRQLNYCTCEAACLTGFVDEATYDECLGDCAAASLVCIDACIYDPSPAVATQLACDTVCLDEFEDCIDACDVTQAACELPCYDIVDEAEQDACFADCIASGFACQELCYPIKGKCNYQCGTDFIEDTRDGSIGQATCEAACCSDTEGHYKPCLSACLADNSLRNINLVIAIRNCKKDYIIGIAGDTPIFHADASACENPTEQEDINNDYAKCAYDCRTKLHYSTKICDEYTPCRGACIDTYNRAISACVIAGGGDAYDPCVILARHNRYDCELVCCVNENGRDAISAPALECIKTYEDCVGVANKVTCADEIETAHSAFEVMNGACMGDPCLSDPESIACEDCQDAEITYDMAQAASDLCLGTAIDACTAALVDCRDAIEGYMVSECYPCLEVIT